MTIKGDNGLDICHLSSCLQCKTPNPNLLSLVVEWTIKTTLVRHFIGVKLNNLRPDNKNLIIYGDLATIVIPNKVLKFNEIKGISI